jgi:Uma2 family endonuclease
MGLPQRIEYYTYEDWLAWDEDVRAEIIDGELYMLAAPLQKHQEISFEISGQLRNFLKGKPCKAFHAPFGVRLSEEEDTVLEPDIIVVCDSGKLDGKVCNGAPDLVVEILSPSTARLDKALKFNKYQNAGVREYWIVDPDTETVQAFVLDNGRYYGTAYVGDGVAPISVLPGCEIILKDVFAE